LEKGAGGISFHVDVIHLRIRYKIMRSGFWSLGSSWALRGLGLVKTVASLCLAPVRDRRDRFVYLRLLPLPAGRCSLQGGSRMSMAHSLEVYVPLLDHLLLE
jgi:hypothetical protein